MRQHDTQRTTPRPTLYQEVTDKIIAELEAGRVPWVQPWGGAKAALGLPRNAATSRRYSGINVLILWGAVIEQGYACQNWLTFRQALALGGNVRKGEHGTTVCYADRFIPRKERERAAETGETAAAVRFLKRFTVFNVEQCDGLPETALGAAPPLPERLIIPRAEALIAATGADFRIGGGRAYYDVGGDFIQVPPQPAFFEQINYYRTCFHELGHWTGHASRCARDLTGVHGSKNYAREELVAEMASAFMCALLSIAPTVRHADYLGSWLGVLREDARAIFRAASQASKAADFVLACEPGAAEAGVARMTLIPDDLRAQLLRNGDDPEADHVPVLKLFNPTGAATWLITEMLPHEPDFLFGLCDLGMGFPELGYVSLAEIESVKGRLGLGIERDLHFIGRFPLSVYTEAARQAGAITESEALLTLAAVTLAASRRERDGS